MGKEMRWLNCTTWFITSVAALNIGLNMFGWGITSWPFVQNLSMLYTPTAYIVGLSGLISLVYWFRDVMGDQKY